MHFLVSEGQNLHVILTGSELMQLSSSIDAKVSSTNLAYLYTVNFLIINDP
jgi:hypothetical protein